MRRTLRILRRVALGLVVLVMAFVGVGLVVAHTDRFLGWMRGALVAQLNAGWKGELAVGRIEGSILGDLVLHDVRLRYQDVDVLVVPRVGLGYAIVPILSGRVDVTELALADPVADLRQDAEGRWNVLEALAAKVVERVPASEGGLAIDLREITLERGKISITTPTRPTVVLGGVGLEAEAALLPKGVTAEIRRLAFEAVTEGYPPLRATAALSYAGAEPPQIVRVRDLRLETDRSKVALTARVANLEALATDSGRVTLEGDLALERLAGADLVLFSPQWRAEEDVSGKLALRGPLAALEATLELATGGARLAANARADVVAEPMTYEAKADVAGLELARIRQDLAGAIEASLGVRGKGFALGDVEGDLRAQAANLAYGEYRADSVALVGHSRGDRVEFELDAMNGPGRAIARGNALVASEPTAHVEATVTRWTVAKDAEVERARVVADVGDGRLRLADLTVAAKGATAKAKGDLGLRADRSGRLAFEARAADLRPWMALVGRSGTGSFALHGTARGSTANLALDGALEIAPLCDDSLSIRRARAEFAVTRLGGEKPEGRASLDVEEIGRPVRLERVVARSTFGGAATARRVTADLTVHETKERAHRLRADAELRPDAVRAKVAELTLALEDGSWRLESPATIVARSGGVEIDRLGVANGERRIWVAGKAGLQGPQALALAIERFPIANLRPFLGERLSLAGAIGTKIEIGGTAAAPTIEARAEVAELAVAGQRYEGFTAALHSSPGATTLDAAFRQDATRSLVVAGRVPLQVRWDGAFQSDLAGPIDLTARSPGLSLAFLNLAGEQLVRDATGDIVVDVAVRGPIDAPVPTGSFALRGATLVAVPLGVDFRDVTVEGSLAPDRIAIPRFSMASGRGGTLTGEAVVNLVGRAPDSIRASLVAQDFAAVRTNQAWTKVSGKLDVTGPVAFPHVKGDVVVEEAIIRPDLEFLGSAPKARDPTIRIVPIGATTKPVEAACAEVAPAPAATLTTTAAAPFDYTLDVGAELRGNSWIKHSSATVELTGKVRALKGPAQPVVLVGAIETRRGWAELQGKRFEITTGKVAFTGGETIDPSLDVVAAHKAGEYRVEAVVGGTANEPSLELRSDPWLEQADVLSVLLFGKPANQLSEGEQQALSERATEMATAYAVTAIGRSVANALGLEKFGIHVEEVSTSRVALGKYVSEKTFVSVAQTLDEEPGQEVAIEYRFRPTWAFVTSTTSTGNSAADVIWRKQY